MSHIVISFHDTADFVASVLELLDTINRELGDVPPLSLEDYRFYEVYEAFSTSQQGNGERVAVLVVGGADVNIVPSQRDQLIFQVSRALWHDPGQGVVCGEKQDRASDHEESEGCSSLASSGKNVSIFGKVLQILDVVDQT